MSLLSARRLCLVAAAAVAVLSGCQAHPPAAPPAALPRVPLGPEGELPAGALIGRDRQTKLVTRLESPNLSAALEQDPGFRALVDSGRFDVAAITFVTAHRSLFGVTNPSDEFAVKFLGADLIQWKHVRLQQHSQGVPIWGAELFVHFSHENHVALVLGRTVRTPVGLNLTPAVTAESARQTAATALQALAPDCQGCDTELVLLPHADTFVLAYRVSGGSAPRWQVMVDASTGKVMDKGPTKPRPSPVPQG